MQGLSSTRWCWDTLQASGLWARVAQGPDCPEPTLQLLPSRAWSPAPGRLLCCQDPQAPPQPPLCSSRAWASPERVCNSFVGSCTHSYCCCIKLPQTQCLKITQIYFYSSACQTSKMHHTGLKSRQWQGCFPSGESVSLPFPSSGVCPHSPSLLAPT